MLPTHEKTIDLCNKLRPRTHSGLLVVRSDRLYQIILRSPDQRKEGWPHLHAADLFFLSSNRTMMMRVKGTCSRNKANKIRRNGVYATRSNTRVHGDYMHRATHYVTSTFTVICFQSMSYLFYYHETNSLMNCSPRWLRARVRQILGSFPTGRDTGDPTLQPLALKLIY